MAPLPAPVVPSNSASFQSCINSTASSSSQFPADISDPSLLNNPVYDQQPGVPVYDYSSFPHASMQADTKPGWDVLGGVAGVTGSTNYPSATATSPQYQQYPPVARPGTPRGTKRMMTPRSAVASSHMVRMYTALCLSVCLSHICVCRCV